MSGSKRDRRWWRPPSPVGDALFALVLVLLTVGGSIGEAYPFQPSDQVFQGHPVPVPPWPAYLLVAVAAVVTVGRRRWPWWVLLVSSAAVAGYTELGYVNGAGLLAPLVALYTIAVVVPLRQALLAAAGVVVGLGWVTVVFNPLGTFSGVFPVLPAVVAVALFAGVAVANRRGRITALAARAELAERTREEEARRRVDAERLRIARELHDVVAHTMATINVQAGAVAYASPDLPAPAAAALAAIKDASKRGLGELRTILSVLRQVDEEDSTQPTPGLSALDSLVRMVSSAGLQTIVEITGVQRVLPAQVDLAAYRIIQESLTNALRHAAPATATIRLTFSDAWLDVEVSDTGPGPATSTVGGSGHGLRGMAERAVAIGGTLTAGPGPHGGFRVCAHLPTGAP
jgi:signal transduction histidine kinase